MLTSRSVYYNRQSRYSDACRWNRFQQSRPTAFCSLPLPSSATARLHLCHWTTAATTRQGLAVGRLPSITMEHHQLIGHFFCFSFLLSPHRGSLWHNRESGGEREAFGVRTMPGARRSRSTDRKRSKRRRPPIAVAGVCDAGFGKQGRGRRPRLQLDPYPGQGESERRIGSHGANGVGRRLQTG